MAEVIDFGGNDDAGLIETPEAVIMPPMRGRIDPPETTAPSPTTEERPPRRARGPRRPKDEGKAETDPPPETTAVE